MKGGKKILQKIRKCMDGALKLEHCLACEARVGDGEPGGAGGVALMNVGRIAAFVRVCDACADAFDSPENRVFHEFIKRKVQVGHQRGNFVRFEELGYDLARH